MEHKRVEHGHGYQRRRSKPNEQDRDRHNHACQRSRRANIQQHTAIFHPTRRMYMDERLYKAGLIGRAE